MAEAVNGGGPRSSLGNERPSLDGDHDPHFEPIITLPEVKIPTLEEEETVLHRARAKLFRHDSVNMEWKERGTGEAKLLYNKEKETVRIIMRRDKTFRICANHYVTPEMKLRPKNGTDRVWLWTTPADVSDGVPKPEILAMRFMNSDTANKWKEKFEESIALLTGNLTDDQKDKGVSSSEESDTDEEVTDKVSSLSIKEADKPTDDLTEDKKSKEEE